MEFQVRKLEEQPRAHNPTWPPSLSTPSDSCGFKKSYRLPYHVLQRLPGHMASCDTQVCANAANDNQSFLLQLQSHPITGLLDCPFANRSHRLFVGNVIHTSRISTLCPPGTFSNFDLVFNMSQHLAVLKHTRRQFTPFFFFFNPVDGIRTRFLVI